MHDSRQRPPQRRPRTSLGCCHEWPPGIQRPVAWFQLSYSREGVDEHGQGVGRIIEVFIDFDNPKNEADSNTYRDYATIISVALQCGATVEMLANATGHGEVIELAGIVDRPHTPLGTNLRALVAEG